MSNSKYTVITNGYHGNNLQTTILTNIKLQQMGL
jgi:hypothetical protein